WAASALPLLLICSTALIPLPLCDSPEAEEAALVAQNYLNAQHTHGYKYALNRIEDINVLTRPDGDIIYGLEIDLLETDCHVLDPTPVANCTVRPKLLTAVEGDCDVVLKKVGGALTVIAFKLSPCTQKPTCIEDLCLGCYSLLPLNDTAGLEFAHASLATFNNNTVNVTYTILEVGRMSSQVGSNANSTAVPDPALPPAVHVFTGSPSHKHGLRHHKLTSHHDPHLSGLLSAESAESDEIVPIVPAVVGAPAAPGNPAPAGDSTPAAGPTLAADPAPAVEATPAADAPAADAPAADSGSASDSPHSSEIPRILFKRDVAVTPDLTVVDGPGPQTDPILLVPACPGRVRFFK
uniref:Alpha-2-HS-glycoprotein 2 n=1 Tax=Seriola dumerili TaxID=41447 RepID=A0A3B4U2M8_SERDU